MHLGLYAVALVLAATFAAQPHELLSAMLCSAFVCGACRRSDLNEPSGPRPSHYALSPFAAIGGAVASTRQVLLHIMPGDTGAVRRCSATIITPGR